MGKIEIKKTELVWRGKYDDEAGWCQLKNQALIRFK